MKNTTNFADKFLSSLMNKDIIIYLQSGIKLTGKLLDYDKDYLLVDNKSEKMGGKPQLVFTHAISTILPDNSTTK